MGGDSDGGRAGWPGTDHGGRFCCLSDMPTKQGSEGRPPILGRRTGFLRPRIAASPDRH